MLHLSIIDITILALVKMNTNWKDALMVFLCIFIGTFMCSAIVAVIYFVINLMIVFGEYLPVLTI
jgi:hypothetical protein